MIDQEARRQLRANGWLHLHREGTFEQARGWLGAIASALSDGRDWPRPRGPVVELVAREGSRYATQRAVAVPFHNDGVHLHDPTRYVLLWCDRPADGGGDTLVVRGDEVRAALAPGLAQRLREQPVTLRVGDHRTQRPWLGPHPDDGDEVLSWFDPALADGAELEAGPDPDALVGGLRRAIAAAPRWRLAWRRGDLLVLDNLRTLHARDAYRGPRRLLRCVVGPWAAGRELP